MHTPRDAAEEIVRKLKQLYTTPHTHARVEESSFPHLDVQRYRDVQAALKARAYRLLGDYEASEMSNSPGSLMSPTMIRRMISSDGRTTASTYQLRPRLGRLVDNLVTGLMNFRFIDAPAFFLKTVETKQFFDFESELADVYVLTSNATRAAALSSPASFDIRCVAESVFAEVQASSRRGRDLRCRAKLIAR